MKTFSLILALATLAGSAHAQLFPLPPSSTTDGIIIQAPGPNAGVTHWDDPTKIASFQVVSTTPGYAPLNSPTYNPIGLPFATTIPSAITNDLTAINAGGGTVRAIVLAGSSGWMDSFGYAYSGVPQASDSYTVLSHFNSLSIPPWYGSYVDIPLLIGDASTFDFWLNGPGIVGADIPPPTQFGGVYTVFHPTNSQPAIAPYNVWFGQRPLMVSTWLPGLGMYENVSTYVVGVEDWRIDRGADLDHSDFVFALQFFDINGTPFGNPVPEPSTYGMAAAILVLGLAVLRQRRQRLGSRLAA